MFSQGLSGEAGWQRARAGSLADGLGEWCGATAGDGGMITFGLAVTLPTFGHAFLGSWASPGVAQWLI